MFKRKSKPVTELPVTVPAAYVLNSEQTEALTALAIDADNMVNLGDITRSVLREQPQYIASHFSGLKGTKVLTDGLRVDVTSSSYHEYRIHSEDALEFIARLRTYRHYTNQRSL